MEENKRLLNVLCRKSLVFRSKPLSENPQLQLTLQQFKSLINDTVFEHLAMGQHEWVNIQSVIRSAFKSLHQALILQSDSVQFWSANFVSKTDQEEILERIGAKTDAEEFKKSCDFIFEKLQNKAETKDLDVLENSFLQKSAFLDFQKTQNKKTFELENSLLSKNPQKDFENLKEITVSEFSQFRLQLKKMEEEIQFLRQKTANQESINETFEKRLKTNDTILKELKPILKNCVSKTEISEMLKEKVDCTVLSKQIKIVAELPTKTQVENSFADKIDQLEKEISKNSTEFIAQQINALIYHPKTEIEHLKSTVKNLQSQIITHKQEFTGELNKSKSHQTQLGSQILSFADKNEVDSNSKKVENKIAVLKQEWNRQIDSIGAQLNSLSDSLSNVKISLHDEVHKSAKSQSKKQDSLCEKILEVESKVSHLSGEHAFQSDEFLKLITQNQTGLHAALQTEVDVLRSENEATQNSVRAEIGMKLNSSEFAKYKKANKEVIRSKVHPDEVNLLLEKTKTDFNDKNRQLKNEFEKLIDVFRKETLGNLKKKVTLKDIEIFIADKVSSSDFQLTTNPIIAKINEFEEKLLSLQKKLKIRQDKLTISLNTQISQLQVSTDNKPSHEELQKLVCKKANIEDFNVILSSLQNQMQEKANSADIQKLIDEQEQFNEFFSTESIIARYKWKSGQFANTPFVPFEVECLNTLKENFIWEKNATALVISNGGLYEIAFGFFSKQKPAAKLYFNNEVVCSLGNFGGTDTLKSPSSTLKSHGKEDKKNLNLVKFPANGLTSFDYYLVPDNCKLSLYVLGEMIIEGFINIRRL